MQKVHPDQTSKKGVGNKTKGGSNNNKNNNNKKVKKKNDEVEDEVEKDIYDSLEELCAFRYYNSGDIDYSLNALEVLVSCINVDGGDVNHWFGVDQKHTALHLIVLGSSHSTETKTEYIKYLLKNGANKDIPLEHNGYCPFLCAVSAGELKMARLFVDIDPSSINRCDQFCPVGTQVIVNVIKTQQSCLGTVVKINVDSKTTYDIKTASGQYIESIEPAQLRVLYRGKEIKGSKYGEKVKIEFSEYGLNALHVACGSHEVSVSCHDKMIEFLLQSGINPNKISNNGSTALHLAAQNRLPKCIAVLLNNTILYSIEVYIKDFAGKTFVELMEVDDRVSLFSSLDYSIELLSAFNYFIWFAIIQTDEPLSNLKVNIDFGIRGSGVDPANVVDKSMPERYDILREKVKHLVSSYPVLADARNADGRSALDMASNSLRGILQEVLLWHGRYRVVESSPEHVSATCCVYKALDERQLDSSGQPSQVALKLMNTKSHFVRECSARERNLSSEFVVTVLHCHPMLQSSSSSSSSSTEFPDIDEHIDMDMSKICRLSTKDSIERMYLLVMPWGSRNLFTSLKQERWAGRNQDEIRHVFTQLVRCVEHLHTKNMIHGDIKPLNFLRTSGQWQLIDLDAVASLNGGFVGLKYSSAYVPPEAVHVDSINGIASVKTPHSREKLVAHQSFDVWALGCILYQMANIDVIPLFQGNQDDNLSDDSEDNLYALANWNPDLKKKKLSRIADKQICNLLSQMLHKDPLKRPSLSRVLAHPFISLKKVTRLAGEVAKFDAFISYRVASDLLNAEMLYNLLTSQGLSVFWDKVCLQPGEDWEKGFCEGLINSRSFIPLLSQEALNSSSNDRQNLSKLDCDSPCDNVLLEYRLAIELKELGFIEKIFPIFIGNYDMNDDTYGNYFSGGCHPSRLPDISVTSLEEKLRIHMEYQSLGTPINPDCTVKHIVTTITNCQGAFIEGRKQDSFDKAAESIIKMCTSTLLPPSLDIHSNPIDTTQGPHEDDDAYSIILLKSLLKSKNREIQEIQTNFNALKDLINTKDKEIEMMLRNLRYDE